MAAFIFLFAFFITRVLSARQSYDELLLKRASTYPPLNSQPDILNDFLTYGSLTNRDDLMTLIIGGRQPTPGTCPRRLKEICRRLTDADFSLPDFFRLFDRCEDPEEACKSIVGNKPKLCDPLSNAITSEFRLSDRTGLRLGSGPCEDLMKGCFFREDFCGSAMSKLCSELQSRCFRAREWDSSDASLLYAIKRTAEGLDMCIPTVKSLCSTYSTSTFSLLQECIRPGDTCEELTSLNKESLTTQLVALLEEGGLTSFFHGLGIKFGIFPRGHDLGEKDDYTVALVIETGEGDNLEEKCRDGFEYCPFFSYLPFYKDLCDASKNTKDIICPGIESTLTSSGGAADRLNSILKKFGFKNETVPFGSLEGVGSETCHTLLEECGYLGFINHDGLPNRCRNVLRSCLKISGRVRGLLYLEWRLTIMTSSKPITSDGCRSGLRIICHSNDLMPDVLKLCLNPLKTCELLAKLNARRCQGFYNLITGPVTLKTCEKFYSDRSSLGSMCTGIHKDDLGTFIRRCGEIGLEPMYKLI